MNRIFCIFFTLCILLTTFLYSTQDVYSPLTLKDPKEIINLQIKSLSHLMAMTQISLEKMEQLRTAISNYQSVQNLYLERTHDKELLFRMTKMADQILKEIKAANLTHAFDAEFLSELSLLSRIYHKNELPKL